MSEKVILKKYPNRRLYNTHTSNYVTLDQVADMIKQGQEIEVKDAKSNDDVTSFILTQILLEQSKQNALLPVSLLHLLIRYGDNILNEFFHNYLEQTIEVYLNYKSMMDSYFKKWLEMGMDLTGKSQQPQNSFLQQNPFAAWMDMWGAGLSPHRASQDKDQQDNE